MIIDMGKRRTPGTATMAMLISVSGPGLVWTASADQPSDSMVAFTCNPTSSEASVGIEERLPNQASDLGHFDEQLDASKLSNGRLTKLCQVSPASALSIRQKFGGSMPISDNIEIYVGDELIEKAFVNLWSTTIEIRKPDGSHTEVHVCRSKYARPNEPACREVSVRGP